MAALLGAPVYFVNAVRRRTLGLGGYYVMLTDRTNADFNCPRRERPERIEKLARDYAAKLEELCVKYPYQWYNFFNFWSGEDNCGNEKR
jgi:predicted LPLAT superfamily acyltransferase